RPFRTKKMAVSDEVRQYREAFSLFDKDHDDIIAPQELGIVLRSCGLSPSEADLQKIQQQVGRKIDFDTFVKIAKDFKANNKETEEDIREAFRVFDKDGTGYVSVSELKHAMISLGERLTEEEVDELTREADIDADAESNSSRTDLSSSYRRLADEIRTKQTPSNQLIKFYLQVFLDIFHVEDVIQVYSSKDMYITASELVNISGFQADCICFRCGTSGQTKSVEFRSASDIVAIMLNDLPLKQALPRLSFSGRHFQLHSMIVLKTDNQKSISSSYIDCLIRCTESGWQTFTEHGEEIPSFKCSTQQSDRNILSLWKCCAETHVDMTNVTRITPDLLTTLINGNKTSESQAPSSFATDKSSSEIASILVKDQRELSSLPIADSHSNDCFIDSQMPNMDDTLISPLAIEKNDLTTNTEFIPPHSLSSSSNAQFAPSFDHSNMSSLNQDLIEQKEQLPQSSVSAASVQLVMDNTNSNKSRTINNNNEFHFNVSSLDELVKVLSTVKHLQLKQPLLRNSNLERLVTLQNNDIRVTNILQVPPSSSAVLPSFSTLLTAQKSESVKNHIPSYSVKQPLLTERPNQHVVPSKSSITIIPQAQSNDVHSSTKIVQNLFRKPSLNVNDLANHLLWPLLNSAIDNEMKNEHQHTTMSMRNDSTIMDTNNTVEQHTDDTDAVEVENILRPSHGLLCQKQICQAGSSTQQSPEISSNVREDADKHGECIISKDEIHSFIVKCMLRVGTKPSHAAELANNLACADYRGHYSHGLNRLDMYVEDVKSGTTERKGEPQIMKNNGATALVDGKNLLGPVVGSYCMDLAIEKAKKFGVGVVSCRHSNHFGIAGYYSLRAVEKDLIGWSFTNTSPLLVPTRSKQQSLGTNPISFAAPGKNGDSFVLDMATSTVAFGKIELSQRKGDKIPNTWGCNEEVTRPEDVRGLLSLGGPEESGGYKGYGLAMMVEILCGILSGSHFGPWIRSWKGSSNTEANLGHCFIAINPMEFEDEFENRLQKLIDYCRRLDPTEKQKPVLIAGDPERAHIQLCNRLGGIPYHQSQIDYVHELASVLKVDLPTIQKSTKN
ncbi:unnamed protein product, partial [Didymodactylos carnosus]